MDRSGSGVPEPQNQSPLQFGAAACFCGVRAVWAALLGLGQCHQPVQTDCARLAASEFPLLREPPVFAVSVKYTFPYGQLHHR